MRETIINCVIHSYFVVVTVVAILSHNLRSRTGDCITAFEYLFTCVDCKRKVKKKEIKSLFIENSYNCECQECTNESFLFFLSFIIFYFNQYVNCEQMIFLYNTGELL